MFVLLQSFCLINALNDKDANNLLPDNLHPSNQLLKQIIVSHNIFSKTIYQFTLCADNANIIPSSFHSVNPGFQADDTSLIAPILYEAKNFSTCEETIFTGLNIHNMDSRRCSPRCRCIIEMPAVWCPTGI